MVHGLLRDTSALGIVVCGPAQTYIVSEMRACPGLLIHGLALCLCLV